jgi:hypothetical protein
MEMKRHFITHHSPHRTKPDSYPCHGPQEPNQIPYICEAKAYAVTLDLTPATRSRVVGQLLKPRAATMKGVTHGVPST